MDASQDMEQAGIAPFEIDWNHRKAGTLDEFHHVLRPRFVLHDAFAADGRPVFTLLPGSYFAGREKTERSPVGDMAQGLSDA